MGTNVSLALVGVALAVGCGQVPVSAPDRADSALHTTWYDGYGGGWNTFGYAGTPPGSGLSDYFRSRSGTPSVTGWGGVADWGAYYPSAGPIPGYGVAPGYGLNYPYAPPIYANNTGAPFSGPYTFGASLGYPFSPWRVF